MKIAVITGLSGLNSDLQDPSNGGFEGVDYYAFTDRPYNVKVWQQKPLIQFSKDATYSARRNVKLPKILAFMMVPGYDYYIWHDHHCEVQVDPKIIIEQHLKDADIAVFKHPRRDCVFEELHIVAISKFDTVECLNRMHDVMRRCTWKEHSGLYEMTSFIYRNSPKTQAAMLNWWDIIVQSSSRDQLSFPLAAHMNDLKLSILPGSALPYGGSNIFFPKIRGKEFGLDINSP
ncbi:DUF616 domain-containing protein [bacterium]|nr:DUF616 domain-containing protein [Candidatus Elulimicrobium humile]